MIDRTERQQAAPQDGVAGEGQESTTARAQHLDGLDGFTVEVPSWAYGNSGTRFKVFTQPGVPRNPYEKISDAAQVHRLTGLAPRISLHIPWDVVDDWSDLRAHAEKLGVRLGAVNANLFQDDEYKLGSLCHPDPAVRDKAVRHHLQCIEIMHATGSTDLKIWLPDGLNYPGQDSLRGRQDRLAESLRRIYDALGDEHRILLEYKFFEPYFYSMDIPDWGTSLLHCLALGDKATVVLDTGHHAPGTNIEFIVMQLLRQGRLGAFDFNSRFYADDDLIVGAADPFQLFRIMSEIVAVDAHLPSSGVNFMLDQCHNIEEKIPGQIRSVLNVEQALAKALLIDRSALAEAQRAGDVLGANDILTAAFETDVRGLLADRREDRGLPRDPVAAFKASGYAATTAAERVGGNQAGWGA
ncbi:L-rhamnose isomerase [Actinoplanes sp. NPDC020271]|uniref:L-rhamnose isomerase n=1 Tax=Actinoplanes sp. NPDC020271 TaxID=3363896 RepID=UPI0037BA883C